MAWETSSEDSPATRRLGAIHRRLCREYGCPVDYFHHHDPLSELISALLSHRTRNAQSGAAFRALKARYPAWEDLASADPAEVETLIAMTTWPELKAPRIIAVLQTIRERRGELSLDFLGDLPLEDAKKWLAALPGVGPKTVAATLLFSALRLPVMPVDSHHHRVAMRLGLIAENTSEGKSHAILQAMLPEGLSAQEVYDHHEVMMFHGQRCCTSRHPACERCVLLDGCPTGLSRVDAVTREFAEASQGALA